MNGREAVSEFVRESGRQLAKPGQGLFQPQLLFQLHDVGQIREQTDRGVERSIGTTDMRDGHAQMPLRRCAEGDGAPRNRSCGFERFRNQIRER